MSEVGCDRGDGAADGVCGEGFAVGDGGLENHAGEGRWVGVLREEVHSILTACARGLVGRWEAAGWGGVRWVRWGEVGEVG